MASGSVATGKVTETFITDIPNIFSFQLDESEFSEALRPHVQFANQRLKIFLQIEIGRIRPKNSFLKKINDQLRLEFETLEVHAESDGAALKLIEHINFMKSYLIFRFGVPPDPTGLAMYCKSNSLSDPASYWYRAVAYFLLAEYRKDYSNKFFAVITHCI